MFKAKVNTTNYVIEATNDGFVVDGSPVDWDIKKIDDGYFHIIQNNKSYRAEQVKFDVESKTFTLKINNNIYTVAMQDKFDILLEKMGMNASSASRVNSIKAPMPGLIIDLRVKEGDAVKTGDPLLILEAMKMENIIKSPGEGIVKSVKVKKGAGVEKGQVLIEF